MHYPVVIHKDADSDYGVTVPDLPGCFSAGATLDEALALAREAIELHLEGLIEAGEPVPRPTSLEAHRRNRDYRGGTWAVVTVDPSNLRVNAKRINITIPQRVLDAVDRCARQAGATRSGLLVRAVSAYMSDQRSARQAARPRRPAAARKRAKSSGGRT